MLALIAKILIFVISYLFIVLPALPLIPLLYASVNHTLLGFSPNQLRTSHVTLVIIVLLLKPLLKVIGFVPPLKPNSSMKDLSEAFVLPDLSVSMPVKLTATENVLYDRAIGTSKSSGVPANGRTPPFLLVGVTEPLMLLLLPKTNCPILPLGSVNVRNRFEFLDPGVCRGATMGALQNAKAESKLVRAGRRVKRGMEFDVVIEVTSARDGSSERRVVLRQVITLLQFLKSSVKPQFVESDRSAAVLETDLNELQVLSQGLGISAEAPLHWAAVCKDYNPIHTSVLAAKLFGFPGKLAHGNLVVARVLELLHSSTATVFKEMLEHTAKPFWLEVNFRRPMVVPVKLQVAIGVSRQSPGERDSFQVKKGDKVYIEGAAGWL